MKLGTPFIFVSKLFIHTFKTQTLPVMQETQHLLGDIEQETYLEPASKGARLLNYIIDIIAFYAITFVISFVWGLSMLSSNTQPIEETADYNQHEGTTQLILLFSFLLIILAYYTLMEGFTKGRTIGKFFTGTQAVHIDGSNISFKQAFLRSISRFVPFEPFSAFGYAPWHDSWTDTIVIKKKK